MTVIIPDQGEQAILEDGVTGVAYMLRLFTNDALTGLTPTEVDALTELDLTEATFTGYAAAAVAAVDWTVTAGDPTEAVNVVKSFTSTADQTAEVVRGYYVTRTSDGALIWLEELPGPITVEFNTDEIQITPRITLDDREGNEVQTGIITAFGGDTAPTGWLMCDGAAVSRSTYADLFAVVGTAYGIGDGSTTFNLPDLQQRFPLGKAASGTGASLGDTGGAIDHVHSLLTADGATAYARITERSGTTNSPHQHRIVTPSWNSNVKISGVGAAQVDATAHVDGTALDGDTAAENPPFAVVNYMIRT